MRELSVNDLQFKPFDKIGNDWFLLTAGNMENYNTMTASWGGLGVLWSRNVVNIYVRPQRYTFDFMEKSEYFTMTFFKEELRDALKYCGSKSGRDVDKAKECNLTALKIGDSVSFEEGEYVVLCKKLYATNINPDDFTEKAIIDECYPKKDYHRMYTAEIIKVLKLK
ncbi:MAG: flavin reductase family protein [Oscillospiraceae bacterium]